MGARASNSRFDKLVNGLVSTLRDFIRSNHLTSEEYRSAVQFLIATAEAREIPLLLDVFLESTADQVDSAGHLGTESCVEGPFYLPGAPLMKSPAVLPHRVDEPGSVLFFSGAVHTADHAPLAGAVLDIWQSDAEGAYSHFNIPEAEAPFNLRARVIAGDDGRFEVQTWVPSPYQIPHNGPTGALLTALGRHAWRPAHLHIRITHPACETLTTQIFFTGDPWIDADVAGAVKLSLIAPLTKHDDPAELRLSGAATPFYTLTYDFALPRRTMAKSA